jgi:hypothetical protein
VAEVSREECRGKDQGHEAESRCGKLCFLPLDTRRSVLGITQEQTEFLFKNFISVTSCAKSVSVSSIAFGNKVVGRDKEKYMSELRYPSLYQINARVWLTELSRALGKRATLDDIPDAELDRLAARGFDWIWFLRVWQTGWAAQRLIKGKSKTP